jgi:hypothetical protein
LIRRLGSLTIHGLAETNDDVDIIADANVAVHRAHLDDDRRLTRGCRFLAARLLVTRLDVWGWRWDCRGSRRRKVAGERQITTGALLRILLFAAFRGWSGCRGLVRQRLDDRVVHRGFHRQLFEQLVGARAPNAAPASDQAGQDAAAIVAAARLITAHQVIFHRLLRSFSARPTN